MSPARMSKEREEAGNQALAALREAERRFAANPRGGALARTPLQWGRKGKAPASVNSGGTTQEVSAPMPTGPNVVHARRVRRVIAGDSDEAVALSVDAYRRRLHGFCFFCGAKTPAFTRGRHEIIVHPTWEMEYLP